MSTFLTALGIRSLSILMIGWCASLVMKHHSATAKNILWRGVFIALGMLPLLFVKLPSWEVTPEQAPVVYQAVQYIQPLQTLADPKPAPPRIGFIDRTDNTESTRVSQVPKWESCVLLIWVLASVFAIFPLLVGLVNLWQILATSKPLSLPGFESICADAGILKRVRVVSTPGISTPSTAGWRRPVVVLPPSAEAWESNRLEMVLRHELGHVARGDWFFQIFTRLVCIAYAPNPLVWWAASKLQAESETACDDLVLAGGINPTDYARELLAIAKGFRKSYASAAVIGMAHRVTIESRLRAIVDKHRIRSTVSPFAILAFATCLLIGMGLAASFRLINVQYTHRRPLTQAEQQAEFAIRDDVSDHPTVAPILAGAKFTVEPYEPLASHVVVAREGVAKLPNGVTITLNGVAPSDTLSPVWGIDNRTIPTPQKIPFYGSPSFSGSGRYVEAVDRSLLCTITSDKPTQASTASYLVRPQNRSSESTSGDFTEFGRNLPKLKMPINGDTPANFGVWIPQRYATDKVTYRVGVATGDWRSVMDVQNPLHSASTLGQGGIFLNGIPCIRCTVAPKASPTQVRFVGNATASDLVERRALILDARGDLIRGEPSYTQGLYLLDDKDLHRFTHVVIQERDFYWAEFRDIPIRPQFEQDEKRAQGTTWTGTAEGIAPSFEKTIKGLGSVAIKSISIARKEGDAWTFNGQPQWRADGRVLRFGKVAYSSGIPAILVNGKRPTEIELAYQGDGWRAANVKFEASEQPLGTASAPLGLTDGVTNRVDLVVDNQSKEGSLSINIAAGPWKTLDSKPINVDQLPDLSTRDDLRLKSGIAILGNTTPRLIFVGEPTDLETLRNFTGDKFKDVPPNCAHRFVAVLHDGTEYVLRPNLAPGYAIPARHGEDANYLGWLASDLKEIRSEFRPMNKTVTFDHIALLPVP